MLYNNKLSNKIFKERGKLLSSHKVSYNVYTVESILHTSIGLYIMQA